MTHSGSCLCQEVRFNVIGLMRPVINCHCTECLKFHGNFAAYTQVKQQNINILGEQNITWFYTRNAKRGFCKHCGSSLFWDLLNDDNLNIAAGTLNKPTELNTTMNIFTADKSDYYPLPPSDKNYPAKHSK